MAKILIVDDGPQIVRLLDAALTAHRTDGDRDTAYQSGCDAYIAKPTDLDKFLARVVEFVDRPRPR